MIRSHRRWIGCAALIAGAVMLDAPAALAQCPARVEPSFIASLQHPRVVQTAWTLPAITPENVKARGGLRPMMDAEQRQIDADQAALSVEGQTPERSSDRMAMLRDDARLHREYLRLLTCHATAPFGPGPTASVTVGGGTVTVSGSGLARRPRNPGADLVNAFLTRPKSEATEDKIRSERAANDAARTEFNTLQVDANGAAGFVNTELKALQSSLSALPAQKLADEFAFLAGDAPKTVGPAVPGCPKGALGFRGYCATSAYLAVVPAGVPSIAPGVVDAEKGQRAVRALKGHAAAAGVDPVLEYFQLGLEQEGSNGERFLEPVGKATDMSALWNAFQTAAAIAATGSDFIFDLATSAPPPPTEDAVTVGLRQADDAWQELVAGRSEDFRPGAAGNTLDGLTSEMCLNCGGASSDRPPSATGYAALARLVR